MDLGKRIGKGVSRIIQNSFRRRFARKDTYMDIVTSALLAGVTHLGKKSIDDAYNGIKAVLKKKFGNRKLTESIDDLESNPISRVYQKKVRDEIEMVQANMDNEIIDAARYLLKIINSQETSKNMFVQNAQGSRGAIQALNIKAIIQKGE